MRVLFYTYLLASLISVVIWKRSGAKIASQGLFLCSIWSIALFGIYLCVFRFQPKISVFQLIVIQASAPILIALMLEKTRFAFTPAFFWNAVSLSLLATLLYWEARGFPSINEWGRGSLVISVLAFLLQASMRVASRRADLNLIQMYVNLMLMFLLGLHMFLESRQGGFSLHRDEILFGAIFAAVILFVQRSFLFGIRNTSPLLAALGLSSAVPFATALSGTAAPLSGWKIVLALLYSVTISMAAFTKKKSNSYSGESGARAIQNPRV